ncbi:NIF-domain-containing protein [Mycena latifolia]|nr:NIF-domain-containing protein [Mycena latifolia]
MAPSAPRFLTYLLLFAPPLIVSFYRPPSTTTEHDSFTDKIARSRRATGSESSPPRVQTWSTKSFLLPSKPSGPASPPNARPKRSLSSPADFIALASLQRPQPASAASAPLETSPVVARLVSILHRTFIVRVLMLAWNTIHAAWTSLAGRTAGRSRETAAEDGSPAIEKDSSDDETSDEQPTSSPSAPPSPSFIHVDGSFSSRRAHTPRLSPRIPSTILQPAIHSLHAPPGSRCFYSLPLFDLDSLHHAENTVSLTQNASARSRQNPYAFYISAIAVRTLYHAYKRPFVDFFLRTASGWYALAIFTASMQEYADPDDWLDAGRGILAHRLFRDSFTQLPNGSYTKDPSVVDPDLSQVCLIDNSPTRQLPY